MQADQRVETVLEDHHHVDPAQQFTQHDALVDALAAAQGIAGIAHLFPVLEGRTLIVAPELGPRVERGEIGERLRESPRLPVLGAAAQVLGDVESERHRHFLLLDRGEVEVRGRRDAPLGQRDAVVDRREGPAPEDLAGRELGRHDRGRELLEHGLAVAAEPEQDVRHEEGHQPRERAGEVRGHRLHVGIARPQAMRRLHQGRPELVAEDRLDLAGGGGDDRLLALRVTRMHHRLAHDPEAHAAERARGARHPRVARVRRAQHRRAGHGRVGVAGIVVALDGILQRVQHPGAVLDRAAEDAAAVAVDVGPDGAAVETEQGLVGKDQRDGVVVGRSPRRRPRLLAEARHHQIRAHRHAGARAGAERRRARGVVGVRGIAGPRAALKAERGGQDLVGDVAPPGIAGAAVVLGVDGLGKDDRALVAQLGDEHVVAGGDVDVVARVAPGRGPHVLGVERVLEGKHDPVHRHRVEIGISPVGGVQLGRALEGVGIPAKHFAHGRCAGWQRSLGRMPVEVAAAGDRALAPDVQGGERVELAGVRLADDHPELLLDFGIGRRRLHAAELEGPPLVPIEIGQHGGSRDGLGGKGERGAGAHGARRLGDGFAVLGDEHAGHSVIGPDAVDVVLDDLDARDPAGPDGRVQLRDRGFLQTKWRACHRLHRDRPRSASRLHGPAPAAAK